MKKIRGSVVAVVGLGATGSVIAENLARHGIELIVIDRDFLEDKDVYTGNYSLEQCRNALPKARAMKNNLEDFTELKAHVEHLSSENVGLLDDADIIMDGTDNMETRFLINEYAKREGKPWIYTAVIGQKGYSMMFDQKCFSCVFEDVKAGSLGTCETQGVMREVASIVASKSCLKAVNYIAGKEVKEVLEFSDGRILEVESSGCEVCECDEFSYLGSGSGAVSLCGENKYQVERDISDDAFEFLMENYSILNQNKYLLKVETGRGEFTLFRSGRAIIEAENKGEAEAIFDRVLGG